MEGRQFTFMRKTHSSTKDDNCQARMAEVDKTQILRLPSSQRHILPPKMIIVQARMAEVDKTQI
jgi:hypothetical protein